MALLLRYRCHACGAHVDSAGHAAWVRCGHCQALVGIDWQAWFESPAYAAWLRDYPALLPRFTALQERVAAATALVREGHPEQALPLLREAVALQMEVTPQQFPPEVRTDAAYRERYVRYDAWVRLRILADAPLAALYARMVDVCGAMDLSDPLPTLEHVLEALTRLYDRLFELPGFEDPDGMPPASRRQLTLTLTVSAWLPLLAPAQRLAVLRRVHGVNNVRETNAEPSDDLGLYLEWTCPHCALVSFQARTATELICVGCYFKRPFSAEVLGLEALDARCGNCGHAVPLPAGALERACEVCGALVRRLARTGAVEQRFSRDHGARWARTAPLPEEGVAGPVLPGVSRQQQCLAGLGRQASWYATLVPLTRYLDVVRRSLPGMSDLERAALLERVESLPFFEGLSDAGRERLARTRERLSAAAEPR
jgi:DNA-directed RNA polymerase subunit RPC12/RpoP